MTGATAGSSDCQPIWRAQDRGGAALSEDLPEAVEFDRAIVAGFAERGVGGVRQWLVSEPWQAR